jgi:hypothetical protein
MSDRIWRQRRNVGAGVTIVLTLLACASIIAVQAFGGSSSPVPTAVGPSPRNEELYRALATTDLGDGKPLPAVVAKVGSTEISAAEYAPEVAVRRYNNQKRGVGMSEAQMRKDALDYLVRHAAVHEQAKGEGISINDEQVQAFIQRQARQRETTFRSNPEALAAFNALLAAEGLPDGAAYDRDPRTIRAVRWALEGGELANRHLGEKATPEEREIFYRDVTSHAQVTVYITV